MLYTDKGKRKVFNLFILLILFIYIVYLFLDNQIYLNNSLEKSLVSSHKTNIENKNIQYKGLILGGSNSAFGISAKNISQNFGINFINVSLSGEGYNLKNYDHFIQALLKKNIENNFDYVLYSSIKFFNSPPHTNSKKNLYGRHSNILFPSESILQRIYSQLTGTALNLSNSFELDKYGDIKEYNNLCTGEVEKIDLVIREDLLLNYFTQRAAMLRKYFNNQRIFFLIPPTFTDLSLSKEFKQKLILELRNFDINVIEEKRINEIKFYCNSPYHLNKIGRKIRTENLNMDLNKIFNKAP